MNDTQSPVDESGSISRRRKAFALADALGLSREERHAFAGQIFNKDVTTWGGLSDRAMERIIDGLEGASAVMELLRQRV